MILALICRSACPVDGYQLTSVCFPDFTVNKRSLRQRPGRYMTVSESVPGGPGSTPGAAGRCPECGWKPPARGASYKASPWRLSPESAADVEAYRTRKWPEMVTHAAMAAANGAALRGRLRTDES